MKQSLHYHLPVLNPLTSYKDFIASTATPAFIAHCEDDKKVLLKKELLPATNYTILIGPEGDFSTTEIKLALDRGLTPVSLGNNRLRTETAAIVACHSVAFIND